MRARSLNYRTHLDVKEISVLTVCSSLFNIKVRHIAYFVGGPPARPSFRQQHLRSAIHGASTCQYSVVTDRWSEEAACQQEGKEIIRTKEKYRKLGLIPVPHT